MRKHRQAFFPPLQLPSNRHRWLVNCLTSSLGAQISEGWLFAAKEMTQKWLKRDIHIENFLFPRFPPLFFVDGSEMKATWIVRGKEQVAAAARLSAGCSPSPGRVRDSAYGFKSQQSTSQEPRCGDLPFPQKRGKKDNINYMLTIFVLFCMKYLLKFTLKQTKIHLQLKKSDTKECILYSSTYKNPASPWPMEGASLITSSPSRGQRQNYS